MRPITSRGAFGNWLHDAMTERNLTEKELSDILGIHFVTISYHLNGKRNPTLCNLEKYAEFFDVDRWFLYDLTIS